MVAWTGIEGGDSGVCCTLDDKCGEGGMVREGDGVRVCF